MILQLNKQQKTLKSMRVFFAINHTIKLNLNKLFKLLAKFGGL